MPRKKTIDPETLIALIDAYFLENHQSPHSLRMSDITQYINTHGYPEYKAPSLRREKVAREHIEFLKQNKQEKQISFLVTHKTLDVNAFLANNETRPKLVEALTKLDNHYKTICDNALSIQAEAKSYKDTADYYSEKADNYVEELKLKTNLLKKAEKEKRLLKQQLDAYKKVLSEYVYPNVASALLEKQGLLFRDTEPYLNEDNLSSQILEASGSISSSDIYNEDEESSDIFESNVINGLFNMFEEE